MAIEFTEQLMHWYSNNKRDLPWRKSNNPYNIWISEIMLQQTRVEAVKNYYNRFISILPTLQDLADIEEDELLKLWEGLGYYSRVRNMQKAAKILIEKGYENLPNIKEDLLVLPGIGEYTAGAILSIAYSIPTVAIDGNVYRVLGRYYLIDKDIRQQKTYKIYEEKMKFLLPKEHPGDFLQAFMDLGSSICTPKSPNCKDCPLNKTCYAHKEGKETLYPVKSKKKEQKVEEKTIFLLVCNNKVAIKKRENKGLLASMYEFPNTLKTLTEIDIENILNEKNIAFKSVCEIGNSKHIFSHIIWYMKGYIIFLEEMSEEFIWASKEELKNAYSIPSAFSFYLDEVMKIIKGD